MMNAQPTTQGSPLAATLINYDFKKILDLAGRGPIEAQAPPKPGAQAPLGTDTVPGLSLALEPLTAEEQAQREACEQIMGEGLQKALAVSLAARTMQRQRLYRSTHATFALYMEEVWGVKVRQAYRELSRLETLKAINGIPLDAEDLDGGVFKIVAPESHTRPFYNLPLEHRKAAWEEAVATAPNGVMTGKWARAVAEEWKARLAGKPVAAESKEDQSLATAAAAAALATVEEKHPARLGEPLVKEMADTVVRSVRLLRDSIGTPDSANAANVTVALDLLEAYRDHLLSCERRQAAR